MDPVTAFGTAASALQTAQLALKVSSYLWKLAKSISKVDQTVSALAAEADSLSQTCDLINKEIKVILPTGGAAQGSQYDEDSSLWHSVVMQLGATEATVRELLKVVGDDGPDTKDFFARARKQIQLERCKDDLVNIRQRLHTHTQTLQMALQMVNIKVAYLAPKKASEDLALKLEGLKEDIKSLQKGSGTRSGTPSEVALFTCAKDIIRSGKTLYEQSQAGGSVQGGEQAAYINRVVAEWASDVETLRRDAERPSFSDTDTYTPTVLTNDAPRLRVTDPTALDDNSLERLHLDDEDYDEGDDNFELEIAQAALEQGQQSFESKDWREAEELFKEALTELMTIPAKRRATIDIFELEYRLSVCAYHTREPVVAKEALLRLVGQTPTTDKEKARIYDAAYLLAQLHLREGGLEPARSVCDSTWRARSKLLGKTHDSTLESLALLSHIYFALGNAPRARVLMGMIPESRRTALNEGLRVVTIKSLTAEAESVNTGFGLPSPSSERRTSLKSEVAPSADVDLSMPESTRPQAQIHSATPIGMHSSEASTVTGNVIDSACGAEFQELKEQKPMDLTYAPCRVQKPERTSYLDWWQKPLTNDLVRAICNDELAVAMSLIADGFQPSANGNSPALHYAACFDDIEVASALVAAGCDINALVYVATMQVQASPLYFAMGARRPAMVQWLLKHGAKVSLYRPDKHFVQPVWSALQWHARFSAEDATTTISCLSLVLDNGWLVDRDLEENLPEKRNFTLLVQAISVKPMRKIVRSALVGFLLERGASTAQLFTTTNTTTSPLHLAVYHCQPEIVSLLLKHDAMPQLEYKCKHRVFGTDTDAEEDTLCYAVRLAKSADGVTSVQALLDAGANPHSENRVRNSNLPESMRSKSFMKKLAGSALSYRTVTPKKIAMASSNKELTRIFAAYADPPKTARR